MAGLGLWVGEVEEALARVLAGSTLAEFVDVPGLARAVGAAFVRLELYEGSTRRAPSGRSTPWNSSRFW